MTRRSRHHRSRRPYSHHPRLPTRDAQWPYMRPYVSSPTGVRASRRPFGVLLTFVLLACIVVAVVLVATGSSHPASSRDAAVAASHQPLPRSQQPAVGSRQASTSGTASAVIPQSATGTAPAGAQGATRPPSLAQMIGQMIVARFPGPTPSASFLARIRAGQIGGVILFGDNLTGGEAAARQLIRQLQQAARQGGNPPLLIMTDQEGGTVRRLFWAPPVLAASAMDSNVLALRGRSGGSGVARSRSEPGSRRPAVSGVVGPQPASLALR